MSWFEHHERSTKLAAAARKLLHLGDAHKAERMYGEAAAEAERAMALVPPERKITFGVVAMLAHRLWRHARRQGDAARVAQVIRGAPELFPISVSALEASTPASPPTQQKRP